MSTFRENLKEEDKRTLESQLSDGEVAKQNNDSQNRNTKEKKKNL